MKVGSPMRKPNPCPAVDLDFFGGRGQIDAGGFCPWTLIYVST